MEHKEKTVPRGETIEVAKKIAEGIPPSNPEITRFIDSTISSIEEQEHQKGVPPMTQQETKVVEDVKEVLKSTKTLVEEKNRGEPLQKILVYGSEAGASASTTATLGLAGVPTGAMTVESRNMLAALNRLLWKLVQSPEFRDDLKELFSLLNDIIFYDESGKLREAARPLAEVSEGKKSVTEGVREAFDKARQEVSIATSEAVSKAAVTTTPPPPPGASLLSSTSGVTPTFGGGVPPFMETTTMATTGTQTTQISERNKELINRFQNLLTHMSSTEEYRTMVTELFKLFDQLKFSWEKSTAGAAATKFELDPNVVQLRKNVRLLIEQFAGNRSLEPLIVHFRQFIDAVCDDPEVRDVLWDFQQVFKEVLNTPELLNDPLFRDRLNGLINRAQALTNSYRWHEQWLLVRKDFDDLVFRISHDPQLTQFQSSLEHLVKDLTLDEYGRYSLNTAAIDRLRLMFVPLLLHHLREIPLPRVEESTEKLDYWLDNLFLSGEDIAPERIILKLKARSDIAPKQLDTVYDRAILKILVADFAVHIPHLSYWFRRKTFPKIEDEGTATVDLIGRGVSIKIILTTENTIGSRFFTIKKVDVDFSSVKLNIEESQHPVLMGIMTTLFKGRFKTMIEHRLETILWQIIETINDRIAIAVSNAGAQVPSITGKIQAGLTTTVEAMKIVGREE